jgi:N6-adenosine-specific RNA methylase IME4
MEDENPQYDIILADPPWWYTAGFPDSGKGGQNPAIQHKHYPCMKTDAICDLGVPDVTAPDSLLFLWTTGPMLAQAHRVMSAWGFKYRAMAFVWVKQGGPVVGVYTLSRTEFVLLGKKGRIPKPRGIRNARQVVDAPRQRHSAKPPEVRDRITAMFPTQRKLELFSRLIRPGWDAWGLDPAVENDPVLDKLLTRS